jgi:cysteine-rich repeat protein
MLISRKMRRVLSSPRHINVTWLGLLSVLLLVIAPLSLRGLDAYLGSRLYRCRNGIVEPGEQCDDGNRNNRDDCPNDCQLAVCGDSALEGHEECDDGNTAAGDGCSPTCKLERRCGNGVTDPGEQCDDGNLINGDGCSAGCCILSGWSCIGSPSVCRHRCGNGIVEPEFGEQCDDQGDRSGDGCSRICLVEKSWACAAEDGEPSRCHCKATARACGLMQCGDGALNAGEECDLGVDNGTPQGACAANCSVQKGFVCWGKLGEKSICSRDPSYTTDRSQRFRRNVQ